MRKLRIKDKDGKVVKRDQRELVPEKLHRATIKKIEMWCRSGRSMKQIRRSLVNDYGGGSMGLLLDEWILRDTEGIRDKIMTWNLQGMQDKAVENYWKYLKEGTDAEKFKASKQMIESIPQLGGAIKSRGININFLLNGSNTGDKAAKEAARSIVEAI